MKNVRNADERGKYPKCKYYILPLFFVIYFLRKLLRSVYIRVVTREIKINKISLSLSLFIYFSLPSPQSVYTRVSAKFNSTTAKHLQVYRARSRSRKYWKYLAKLHFNWMQIKFAPLTSEASRHLKMFCDAFFFPALLLSPFSPRIVAFCLFCYLDFGKRGEMTHNSKMNHTLRPMFFELYFNE